MTLPRILLAVIMAAFCSCRERHGNGADANVTTRGSVEVTARLVDAPAKALIKRELYDYAGVLKYEVLAVHRGTLKKGTIICVAHYNPFKPRASAADKRVGEVGGNASFFQTGDCHRMALEPGLEDHYMGGIVDEYFAEPGLPRFWAVWTNMSDAPE